MGTKRTLSRDSVFGRTGEPETPPQGIATPQEAPTRQTAVWLSDEEVDWLDERLSQVKKGGWRSVTRSALIRSLIRAAMEQDTDLAGVSGEKELTRRIAGR